MKVQDIDVINNINAKYEDSFIEYLKKVTTHIEKAYNNKDYKTAAQLFKLILLKEDETRTYKDKDIYSKVIDIHKSINNSLAGEQAEVFKKGYLSNYWNGWNSSDTFSLTLKDDYMISEFDKTVNEYKRADNKKKDRIKKELEYIRNPNRYINIYNSYRDKSIAYPLAEYLDIKALQSGFDNYEDMLNEGLKIDYSGEYIKEPDKQHNNDDIELD